MKIANCDRIPWSKSGIIVSNAGDTQQRFGMIRTIIKNFAIGVASTITLLAITVWTYFPLSGILPFGWLIFPVAALLDPRTPAEWPAALMLGWFTVLTMILAAAYWIDHAVFGNRHRLVRRLPN